VPITGWTTLLYRGTPLCDMIADKASNEPKPEVVEPVTAFVASNARFGVVWKGRVYPSVVDAADDDAAVLDEAKVLLLAQYEKPLVSGATHTFSVTFDGDEEASTVIESVPFTATAGKAVEVEPAALGAGDAARFLDETLPCSGALCQPRGLGG
jgi:hypothetical protein